MYGKPSSGVGTASFPMAAGALDFARGAVDKVAGKKTREQLESKVEGLAQSEFKLIRCLLSRTDLSHLLQRGRSCLTSSRNERRFHALRARDRPQEDAQRSESMYKGNTLGAEKDSG